MAQLLEGAMRRAEDAAGRDAVAKFARKLEASEEVRVRVRVWVRVRVRVRVRGMVRVRVKRG